MKVDKFEHQDEWSQWIGFTVKKYSGKKFKGGSNVEVVKGFTANPYSGKPAFLLSDGSIVDCFQVTKL